MNSTFSSCGVLFVMMMFWASCSLVNGDGRLCSELMASDPSSEPDKRNAQLCELVQAADAIEEMSRLVADGLTAILGVQGITADDDSGIPTGDVEKRKNEYLRFGKRKNEYLRFGKRKNEYLRFGKRKNEYLRFGK